jgi:hypothetical protein
MVLFISCGGIDTLPMHTPIYPSTANDVVFTLEARADKGIKKVELYTQLLNLDGDETRIYYKEFEDPQETISCQHNAGKFDAGSLIRYRFVVMDKSGSERSHDVTFAVQAVEGQPGAVLAHEPIPIYCQGDPLDVMDLVFIPDVDITDMEYFYETCEKMITDVFFSEPTIRKWSRQFNFYINQQTGEAKPYDSDNPNDEHVIPTNWSTISNLEVKVIMHEAEFRDYASGEFEGLCSTELKEYGTVLHEAGHTMFKLRDEYHACCAHHQIEHLPNNWDCEKDARSAASSRHKKRSDVRRIGRSGWFKMCNDDCQMMWGGEDVLHFDKPCGDRVVYCIKDAANNTQNGDANEDIEPED